MANDISQSTWSQTDASNTQPSPNGWPAGTLPSQVEPNNRMIMGAVKRFWARVNGTVTSGGSANAQTLTYSVAPTSYVTGETYRFIAGYTNSDATTLNINSLGAKNVYKPGASGPAALSGGEIYAGNIVEVTYDGTQFQIQSQLANTTTPVTPFVGGTLTSTTAMSGAAFNEAFTTIASASTVNIGAAAANYLQVTGTTTITAFDTVQAGTQRVLEFAGVLTLTHNSTTLILPGAASITTAAGDVAFFRSEGSGNWRCTNYMRASGLPVISPVPGTQTAGTTNTMNPVTAAASVSTVAHGLGAAPFRVEAYLECISADQNFSVGDRISFNSTAQGASSQGIVVEYDATNTTIICGAGPFQTFNKSSFALVSLAVAKWKAVAVPYKLN